MAQSWWARGVVVVTLIVAYEHSRTELRSWIGLVSDWLMPFIEAIWESTVLFAALVTLVAGSLLLAGIYRTVFVKPPLEMPSFDFDYDVRRAATFPPGYPNSWWKLCDSDFIKPGEVKEIQAMGQDFAVFRTEDGQISVLDAYCPHLAANLTQGEVVGDALRCPFHAWSFDTDGQCINIPYSDKIPKNASTRSWPVVEKWGMVMVWYHCDRIDPTWQVKEIPELHTEKPLTLRFKFSNIVNMHVQDFAENGPDSQHFSPVHGKMTIPFADYFLKIKHDTGWTNGAFDSDEHHMGYFSDNADLMWKWSEKDIIPNAGAKVTATFHGPGLVIFRFHTAAGLIMLVKTFTPIAPLKQRMEDTVYASPNVWNILVKYIVLEANTQFADDIRIWSRKRYTDKPMVVKGDGNILGVRRWFSQFYSKNSRRGVDLSW